MAINQMLNNAISTTECPVLRSIAFCMQLSKQRSLTVHFTIHNFEHRSMINFFVNNDLTFTGFLVEMKIGYWKRAFDYNSEEVSCRI